MHIHFLDPYRPLASPVHALDARVKLLLSLAFILTCSLGPLGRLPMYVMLFALNLAVQILSGLGPLYVLRRSAIALPFALAALPLLFTTPGQTVFSVPYGNADFTASAEGLSRFLTILFKSWLSVQAAIVLAASTPFPELLRAMRAIGAPQLLVAMFGLMWRYLFVLLDEALRLTRARTARSARLPGNQYKSGGTVAWRAHVAGGMAGNLLVRAFERSERIYSAMLARGYDGEVRSLPLPPISSTDWITLTVGLLVLALLAIVGSVT
ncbi:MAG TPA: cobalt ECF transporter T component CbiQ [Anaerolineales bacterium]|nr:cobalt ECF transporter T component CbiQ [Anaerolineales bacterium]